LIPNLKVVNKGTFKKTAGAAGAETYVGMPFENTGTLEQRAGTLTIFISLTQTGAASVTTLTANATLKAATFDLNGGKMYAEGDFYGDLTNGAWLHPGSELGAFGTLTIHGNYTQTAIGKLYVEVVGVGGVGTLRVVQQDNAGGTATLAQGST